MLMDKKMMKTPQLGLDDLQWQHNIPLTALVRSKIASRFTINNLSTYSSTSVTAMADPRPVKINMDSVPRQSIISVAT